MEYKTATTAEEYREMFLSGFEPDLSRPPFGVKRDPMGWQATHYGPDGVRFVRDTRTPIEREQDCARMERNRRAQYR